MLNRPHSNDHIIHLNRLPSSRTTSKTHDTIQILPPLTSSAADPFLPLLFSTSYTVIILCV